MTIDKLLTREIKRMRELKIRLTKQLTEFEENYGLKSEDFYKSFENGEMGDKMDFIEWAATEEMLANTEKRISLLDRASDS